MSKNKPDIKKIISGHQCEAWLDGRQMAEAKQLNAKVEFKKEAMTFIGEFFDQHKIVGGAIKGSLTQVKADSYQLKLLTPYIKGEAPCPESVIMFNQTNDYGKEERCCLTGVVWDDLTILSMEAGTPAEIEMPFTATGYEIVSTFE